jgi:Ca2+-binding RTX toxin-like protein
VTTTDTPTSAAGKAAAHQSTGRATRWVVAGTAMAAVLLAATACISSAGVNGQTLVINGSAGNDTIVLRLRAGDPNTLEVDDGNDGTAEFAFDRSTFTAIDVEGGAGDDVLRIDRVNGVFTDTEATTLSGGDGNDTLVGDVGSERLDGGPGDDVLDGKTGSDVMIGGDGADSFVWDPGDSSDVIEGGAGVDHLQFNGSNANEKIRLSPNGPRVLLTRDVASVVLDMDDVEAVAVSMLGGTDALTVDNLTGTDLTTVDADLAGFGGVDDGALDEVIVPPGVPIGQDSGAATVGGLGAQVRVHNGGATDRIHVTGATAADVVPLVGTAGPDVVNVTADGTDVAVFGATPGVHVELTSVETLVVFLGSGNDDFSATGNLAPLVGLDVDGGPDADTIRGGNGNDQLFGGTGDDVIDGNQGTDTVSGGDGNDTIQWDPGDGNDTVVGGAGTDRLAFNGSNAAEQIEVFANGSHAMLTRNIASITMDLAEVETIDVGMGGSADRLTVDDLTGTDVRTVNADLAAFGGGDDGAADAVVVNGTAGNDTFTIQDDGPNVEVLGLTAQVNISGSTAALDTLTVNGLAGTDFFSPTPGVAALIRLVLAA